MSDSLRPLRLQHTRLLCPSPIPRAYSNLSIELVMLSNHLILCRPLLLPPSIFPSIRVFKMSQFFASGGQSIEFQLQHQSFQGIFRNDFLKDGLVGSPCSPRDSQESSPTPQFKSITSLVLTINKPLFINRLFADGMIEYIENANNPYNTEKDLARF